MISSDEDKTDKKIYSKISLTKRMAFIKKVLTEKQSVKAAAEQCQIKFSTAKAILKIFRNEGRLGKKSKLSQLLNQIQGQNEEENLLKIVEEEKLRKQQKQEEKEKEHKQLASRLNIFCGEQPKEPEPDVCYIKLAETLYTMVQQEQQKYNYLVAQVNYMSMFRMM